MNYTTWDDDMLEIYRWKLIAGEWKVYERDNEFGGWPSEAMRRWYYRITDEVQDRL